LFAIVFIACRAVIPVMKAQKSGVILNMSSTSGLYGTPNRAAYTASKWAVIGLTKTLAIELGPHGIRCNAICPTSVEGDRIDRVLNSQAAVTGKSVEDIRQDYTAGTSLRRFAKASEIADMCLFLASESAAFVSGQALAVDGNTETYRLD
jgi:NAD(P)-dependent dehydrogenase (short-subunit alcohol dehydrogenase family)